MAGITAALAAWVAGTSRIRRKAALALAKDAMKDIVACMVGGAGDPAVKAAALAARGWGAVPSSALVRGVAAHALDYDDNFHPQAGHATAVLAPALFAVAETRGASGHEVLDAYIVGLEAIACIGRGVNLAHYERGWHSTSTIGAMGAAAACAVPSSAGASFIFCRCGGAGSLVALLPCNHAALCMMCAQRERVCPGCAREFTDSRPSFKAKR